MKYIDNNSILTDSLALKAVDYNGDGVVDNADMAAVLRKVIKK